MKLDEHLRALRQEKKWSQEEVAERLNLSRQAVAKWENGQNVPDVDNLLALASLYEVTLDALVRGPQPCAVKRGGEKADQAALIDFLLRAGAKTYAGQGTEDAQPSRPRSHDLRYREGDWLYIDSYLGGERFSGEEGVWLEGQPQWAMNYSGRELSERFSGDFLKAALLERPREEPYRGPRFFTQGRYAYHNDVSGSFEWFQGKEEIFCDEEKVYELFYHGGIVKA
ncbi:MAG: DUF5680 domain-containing protein [Eubacteriales bacterium]|nr:DUF5680 domain-containing protein [Eubacteriales bacterium]